MTARGRFVALLRQPTLAARGYTLSRSADAKNGSSASYDVPPGEVLPEPVTGHEISMTGASIQRPGTSEEYTGVGTLEVLTCAVKYQRFLTGLLTRASKAPPAGRLVADFGAGLGTFARDARSLGWHVTCVELDPALRARLRADGFATVESLDDISPQSLDFLFSYNVLEHIENDAEVVSAFHRVLKPGAPLLIYVPAYALLYGPLDRAVGHVRRYRRKALIDLVESAGFTVQVCRYSDSIGFVAALAYRFVGSGHLRQRAVKLYDRFVFPASRGLDYFARRFFGKNLVLVARRPGG
jgi:SAM-dependent methyltransferase